MSQADKVGVERKKRRGTRTWVSPDVLRQRLRRSPKSLIDLPKPLAKRAKDQSNDQRTSVAGDGFTTTERALPELKRRGLKLRATVLRYSEGLQLTTDPLVFDENVAGLDNTTMTVTASC